MGQVPDDLIPRVVKARNGLHAYPEGVSGDREHARGGFNLNEVSLTKAAEVNHNKEMRTHTRMLTHREMKQYIAELSKCMPDFEEKEKFMALLPDAFDKWAHGEDEVSPDLPADDEPGV